MKKLPVILDLETKYTFREYSDPADLGITVAAIYDYSKKQGLVFTEKEINNLLPYLEGASYLIGYNIDSFDLPVLQSYYPGKLSALSSFDILSDIKKIIGKRLALNDLISVTLNKKKSGHGLMAVDYYKEGRWDELKKYCLDDVLLTKELFEYGVNNGEIYYLNEVGKIKIPVDWKKYSESSDKSQVSLTLPF